MLSVLGDVKMTKAYSTLGDNGGRCEGCDRPESVHESQSKVDVLLGGGLGWGTMWLCNKCFKEREARKAKEKAMKPKPPSFWCRIGLHKWSGWQRGYGYYRVCQRECCGLVDTDC